MLRAGDLAPDFELAGIETESGEPFRLREKTGAGRAVVVFFCRVDGTDDALKRRLRRASWFWHDAPVEPCVVDTTGRDPGRLREATIDPPCPVLLDPFGVVAEWYGVTDSRERGLFAVGSDRRVAYAWYDTGSGESPVRGVVDALLTGARAEWPEPAL